MAGPRPCRGHIAHLHPQRREAIERAERVNVEHGDECGQAPGAHGGDRADAGEEGRVQERVRCRVVHRHLWGRVRVREKNAITRTAAPFPPWIPRFTRLVHGDQEVAQRDHGSERGEGESRPVVPVQQVRHVAHGREENAHGGVGRGGEDLVYVCDLFQFMSFGRSAGLSICVSGRVCMHAPA